MGAAGGSARGMTAGVLVAIAAMSGACASEPDSQAGTPAGAPATVAGDDSYPANATIDDRVELWWRRHRGEIQGVDAAVNDARATAMFTSDPTAFGQACERLRDAVAAVRAEAVPAPEIRLDAGLGAWATRLDTAVGACTSAAADPGDRAAVEAFITALDAGEDEAARTVTPLIDAYLHESG